MRSCDGRTLLHRPNLYDHIVNNVTIMIVNLSTPKAMQLLNMNGLSCLPCGNPKCTGTSPLTWFTSMQPFCCVLFDKFHVSFHEGKDGKWDTHPIGWQHQTAAPSIFIDENGRCGPIDAARSHCRTCNARFCHTSTTMLSRLKDVSELLALLPFNAEWQFNDVFLHSTWTSCHEYDTIKAGASQFNRQGWSFLCVDMLCPTS